MFLCHRNELAKLIHLQAAESACSSSQHMARGIGASTLTNLNHWLEFHATHARPYHCTNFSLPFKA